MELWQRRIKEYKPYKEQAMDLYEAIQGDAKLEIEHFSIDEIDDKS